MYKILSINPGATSTKIALYEDEHEVMIEVLTHDEKDLMGFNRVIEQFGFRKDAVMDFLRKSNVDVKELSAVVGRGGLLPPVKSGAYKVNELMIDTLINRPAQEHASNLGALIAYDIAKEAKVDAYIYDSVAVDELCPYAKVTGVPEIDRPSHGHALNMRAAAHKMAEILNKPYQECRLIVAHLGAGFTITFHENGRMVDMVGDEEGAFAPERAGRIQTRQVLNFVYSGKYSEREVRRKFRGNAGLRAHLGTVDGREIEKMIESGDEYAALVYDAMAYQIAKDIGEMAVAARGKIDRIVLTGGLAYSKRVTSIIKSYVDFLAAVEVIPGENEMESLTLGTLRVLKGLEEAKEYTE